MQSRQIEAQIDAPHLVEVSKRRKTVRLEVRLTLRNVGEQDFVVHAPNRDHRHFWHVFDENFREVQRERGRGKGGGTAQVKDGVHTFRTQTIAAGHEIHESRALKLDAAKLKDGHTYTIRSEIYGQIAESQFVTVHIAGGAAAAAKSAKKAARKRSKAVGEGKRGAPAARRARKAAKKVARKAKKRATKAARKAKKRVVKRARKTARRAVKKVKQAARRKR